MIDRRDFLKIAGALIPSWGFIPVASAQSSLYTGKVLINIHASGGLDAGSWFDPRESDPLMNFYAQSRTPAVVAGNLRVAPMANNGAFATKYFRNILVLNGVNSETNSHEDGTRAHATGSLAMSYPNMSELFAYTKGKDLPLPWLNAGGMNTSVGLSPAVPMPDGNSFRTMLSPNSANANQDFMKAADVQKVLATRSDRIKAQLAAGNQVPRAQGVSTQFDAATNSRALLARVSQFLPATFDNAAHVGLVAAQAGVACTVQLSTGGFDLHSNIVNGSAQALPRLTDLVDYIITKSGEMGIADRIFIRIYSEFGRTPLINTGLGKDHHTIGTQVLMEATPPAWGNRVFGLSGPRMQAVKINPSTGAVDPVNGKIMTPRHVHEAIRKYLGFTTTDPRFSFRIPADETFDIFNPTANTGYQTM